MESLILSKQLLYLTLHTGIVWPSIELYITHDKYTTIQLNFRGIFDISWSHGLCTELLAFVQYMLMLLLPPPECL